MFKGGYTGKILRINLTDKVYKIEDLLGETAKNFIGGAGFAVKTLFDEVPAKADPFQIILLLHNSMARSDLQNLYIYSGI